MNAKNEVKNIMGWNVPTTTTIQTESHDDVSSFPMNPMFVSYNWVRILVHPPPPALAADVADSSFH